MRLSVRSLIWYLTTHHQFAGPVVDIGSLQAPGQQMTAELRPFFKGLEYIGCDIMQGLGVDRVENAESLTFGDKTVPTILCLDTLEHVRNPLQAVNEISRVISDDGIFVVASHHYAPVHHHPDYWRFTAQCMNEIILANFPKRIVLTIGEEHFPEFVGGIATRSGSLPQIDIGELNSMLIWSYPFPFVEYAKT